MDYARKYRICARPSPAPGRVWPSIPGAASASRENDRTPARRVVTRLRSRRRPDRERVDPETAQHCWRDFPLLARRRPEAQAEARAAHNTTAVARELLVRKSRARPRDALRARRGTNRRKTPSRDEKPASYAQEAPDRRHPWATCESGGHPRIAAGARRAEGTGRPKRGGRIPLRK